MSLKALTGFKDILPDESKLWRQVEETLIGVLHSYGFSQIRLPLVEQTDLFARSVGSDTDIVSKEMFSVSYLGAKDDSSTAMTLRPEGTAGCARAVIEHNLLRGDTPKLWYMGPMFRYERPQKGRYRQFHQLGVESFGSELPDADAEIIAMTYQMWKSLGILDSVQLELNTLGESDERQNYRTALVAYLISHKSDLDEDSQRRLDTNPLRILDSKDSKTQQILQNAPKLSDFLGEETKKHFDKVKSYLTAMGIEFVINENLVRGLDYYNKTVFEWTTDKLGSQATVCGGGRYDGLVSTLQNRSVDAPAVGFGMGLERLILLVQEQMSQHAQTSDPAVCDVFVVAHPDVYVNAVLYADNLRKNSQLRVKMASATALKSQMKKADRSGAKYTVIIGADEVADDSVSVKNMATGAQVLVDSNDFGFFYKDNDLIDELDG